MKKLRNLPLHTHRAISFITMFASCVLGLICGQIWPSGTILCFFVLIGSIIWHIVFVRCPHCGYHFNPRAAIANYCPDCGKELT